ncbi:MAG: type II toxin-antitoxin system VapC family toxin [Acidimicrobiales bacterium]
MTTTFVDTSAFYATFDRVDANHAMSRSHLEAVKGQHQLTHNYVVVETTALLQHRLGMEAVRRFHSELLPVVEIHWVDRTTHDTALAALLSGGRRTVSFVDCVSFQVMRALGIRDAFAFDADFGRAGFRCVPARRRPRS